MICHHDELFEAFWVAIEDSRQACDSVSGQGIPEAEVNDTAVRLSLAKNELPKLAVVRDQDAAFLAGDFKNLKIGQTGSASSSDDRRFVTKRVEIGR